MQKVFAQAPPGRACEFRDQVIAALYLKAVRVKCSQYDRV